MNILIAHSKKEAEAMAKFLPDGACIHIVEPVMPPMTASIVRHNYDILGEVLYRGQTLTILGESWRRDDGGREYPTVEAGYDVCEAWLGDYNLTEFLTGEQWLEVEGLLEEQLL